MKILLTGFDPFGGETVNPAYEAVKLVPENIKGMEIIKLEVPTVFRKGPAYIIEKIRETKPDIVLSIGQAGGRSAITVEFVGINHLDASIPDNEGFQPDGEKIVDKGENAYFSTLPVKAIAENIRANGYPAFISYTAGTYVCNEVLYTVLHYAKEHAPQLKAGFIHVPFALGQVIDKRDGTPSMSVRDIAKAIEHAIEAIVD